MYENIGEKIKILAKVLFGIGLAVSVFTGFSNISLGVEIEIGSVIILGLLTLVLGPLFAWLSTWLLYGFGELIDTNQKLNETVEEELVPTIKELSLAVSKISVVSGTPTSSAPRQAPPAQDDDDEVFSGNFVVDTSVADSFDA